MELEVQLFGVYVMIACLIFTGICIIGLVVLLIKLKNVKEDPQINMCDDCDPS